MPMQFKVVPGELREPGDPIAAIQATLRRYPQAQAEGTAHRVSVAPLNAEGFRVAFTDRGGRYRVDCDGWHAEFRDATLAIGCFTSALSPKCRLKVWRRGGEAYSWELQTLSEGNWASVGAVTNWLIPFWRPREIVILQNRLLEAA